MNTEFEISALAFISEIITFLAGKMIKIKMFNIEVLNS